MSSSDLESALTSPSRAAGRSAWPARGARPAAACARVVLDAGDAGAWQVAAGMLAPVAEAEFGDAAADRARAARRARLRGVLRRAGRGLGRGSRPTARPARCVVARDRDEAEALERLLAFRRELGLEVERLRPSQARRAEPALAPTVRLALDVPGDHSVDPRRLVAALSGRVRARRRHDPPRARRRGRDRRRPRRPACASTTARSCARRASRARRDRRRRRSRLPGRASRAARQGPGPAPARPARARAGRAHDPRPGRLPRPARRRRATCSARRWRSAAATPRRPPAACTSCCAT